MEIQPPQYDENVQKYSEMSKQTGCLTARSDRQIALTTLVIIFSVCTGVAAYVYTNQLYAMPNTIGTILDVVSYQYGSQSYSIDVQYSYFVNNTSYIGMSSIGCTGECTREDVFHSKLSYPINSSITVFYLNEVPSESSINAVDLVNPGNKAFVGIFAIVLILSVCLLAYMCRWSKK
jgi:hypothetical protein